MPNPFRDLFFGPPPSSLVEALVPRRTFDDVVLPPATRRALEGALSQIHYHDLIFRRWGLGERHTAGLGLAFNFAGSPGTGKTICAEAIAHALGSRLLVVRYAEVESQWAGATGKNVAAVFRAAAEQGAVLFFDEADAIAGRRSTSVDQGYQREANTVVSILLRELEEFPGVVIFATNLATNFDPAFERRIRTHILFEMPGAEEREEIWRVQLHQDRTPLADDVDFRALAEAYPASGGDIKNAVLKAALLAASEPEPDAVKRIHQRHFEAGIRDVLAARSVMGQSLYAGGEPFGPLAALAARGDGTELAEVQDAVGALAERLAEVEDTVTGLPAALERIERTQVEAAGSLQARAEVVGTAVRALERRGRLALGVALGALLAALAALGTALLG
jgi:SpoVK/Ycf46/Vps4 family AAA+-type ATPase